jgi:hypothetical protein
MFFRIDVRIFLCHSKNIPYTQRQKSVLGHEWVKGDPRGLKEERGFDIVRPENAQLPHS